MMPSKIKIAQLRALVAVAAAGNFSEGALALDLSQSTVSHSIAALEAELGVVLLNRGRHGATVTPVGERIVSQAQQVLALLESMGREAVQARGVDGGVVRIAAFRSTASHLLPGAIAKLHSRYPSIQVSILELDEVDEFHQCLADGKADFCIAELLEGESFETLPMLEDKYVALLPSNFGLKTSRLTWEDLQKHPIITSTHGSCSKSIYQALQRAVPPVEVAYQIRNDSTTMSMVEQGLGIGILPMLAAQPIPPGVRWVHLPFVLTRWLGASWLRDGLLTPSAFAFLDTFKAVYGRQQKLVG
ncbi:LysR family transcriptional regulator [Romeria aff. gracilis LEGE 07310]|uniref:LysR family transcriptional regulator n=2 Tax=Vasconcelosia TaxID=3366328 RepID=A0A8J7DNE0_9CYAN|nr:LysR family transcriptional regulator [Romeria aff. gracilis LEGE 07310]